MLNVRIDEKVNRELWNANTLTAVCNLAVIAESGRETGTEGFIDVTYMHPVHSTSKIHVWMRANKTSYRPVQLLTLLRRMMPEEFSVAIENDNIIIGCPNPVCV